LSSQEQASITQFPVAVILEKHPGVTRWATHIWKAVAVVVAEPQQTRQLHKINEFADRTQYLYAGLSVQLHVDQCESYYHNFKSPQPSCYVMARFTDEGTPQPFLVSMSFDEAQAHAEGDDEVYAVPIPPELYRWSEQFMLAHYFPEKKHKRKREDWKTQAGSIRA